MYLLCFTATGSYLPFAFANIRIYRRIHTKTAIIFFDSTISATYTTLFTIQGSISEEDSSTKNWPKSENFATI